MKPVVEMGCRLYLAALLHVILYGVSGGGANESHPRRKGCGVIPFSVFIFKSFITATFALRKALSVSTLLPEMVSIRKPCRSTRAPCSG